MLPGHDITVQFSSQLPPLNLQQNLAKYNENRLKTNNSNCKMNEIKKNDVKMARACLQDGMITNYRNRLKVDTTREKTKGNNVVQDGGM